MADGFTLTIDDDLARDLERRAQAAGITPQELARLLLAQEVFDYADYDWIGDDPRTTPTDADSAGEDEAGAQPWSEVRAELEARLEARLRERS